MVMKKYIYSGIRPMSFAMDMQSGISSARKQKVEEQLEESLLRSTINFLLYEWITHVDFPQMPEDFRKLKENKVEALLLSGSQDDRTYLRIGMEIAKAFKKGQYVIIEHGGHDLYMTSPLVGDMALNFFKSEALNLNRIVLEPMVFD